MHSDATEKAHTTRVTTEGIGRASLGLLLRTILKLQCIVIWKPSQIFEESEEGASSRKGDRPFAFAPRFPPGCARAGRGQLAVSPSDDYPGRLCSWAPEYARSERPPTAIVECMTRRNFLALSSACAATLALEHTGFAKQQEIMDAVWYARSRRFASLPMGRIAYVEYGRGPAALFLHGYPLNGYQWRGALERLHPYRRCIAPDVMGLGHTEAHDGQAITPETQVTMLAALLDTLDASRVDVVANDSGGLVAQLFVARYPARVRSLLVTNCDVDENNPPQLFMPVAKLAQKGLFVDRVLAPELKDLQLARSEKGLGSVYTHPELLTEETIEAYLGPLVASPTKKQQADAYAAALGSDVLVPVREELQRWKGPARMVWATADPFFPIEWATWLDKHLPGSRGVRPVEGAKLFFPEEMPEVIAEEAKRLWNV
jgi:haloalkane dehalogenase